MTGSKILALPEGTNLPQIYQFMVQTQIYTDFKMTVSYLPYSSKVSRIGIRCSMPQNTYIYICIQSIFQKYT